MRIGANGAMFFALLVYAAIICIVVRIIKYFIRYGIDYYFEKLAEELEADYLIILTAVEKVAEKAACGKE